MDLDKQWKGIPAESVAAWGTAFASEPTKFRPKQLCPICQKDGLYRFYHLENRKPRVVGDHSYQGDGSLWEWCSDCRHYEHMSSLVPIEWHNDAVVIDASRLRHDPDYLNEMYYNQGLSKR